MWLPSHTDHVYKAQQVGGAKDPPLWLLKPVDGLGGETKSKTWALTPGPGGDLIEDLGTHSRTWWGPTQGFGPTCNPV